MSISDALRQRLRSSDKSLKEIAAAAEVPIAVLSRFLTGQGTGHLSLINAEKLVKYFGLILSVPSGATPAE